jgi:predicted DNA-binding WGR domain protein
MRARMPTRTFMLESPEKRFWDVSWDGAAVEITQGKWGTNGRAREVTFETEVERDAFVAAQIAKALKKGYREVTEIAPAADVSYAKEIAALRAFVESRRRTAWLPQFEPGTEGIGVVRGPMTMAPGEPWPRCSSCGEEMSGLLELDLARVPADYLRQDSLVQLFWCEAWETKDAAPVVCAAASGGWLARRAPRGSDRRSIPNPRGASPFAIVGFTPFDELPPSDPEIRARFEGLSAGLSDDELLRSVGVTLKDSEDPVDAFLQALGGARNEHKLGGFPTFVQAYTRPFSHQIFQIEMSSPFRVNFGDLGAGHLLLGEDGSVDFFWSCH